jgi:hypothetical protein
MSSSFLVQDKHIEQDFQATLLLSPFECLISDATKAT